MGLFRNNNAQNLPQRAQLEVKYNTARMNLIMMVIFTLVNITFISFGNTTYFLFSASLPYYFVSLGAVICGKMPAEYYEELGEMPEPVDSMFFWIMLILAAVALLIYVLCFVASKKNSGWLIAATVLFGIDTLGMFYLYGFNINMILDILFHVWVLFYLIIGIVASNKLKNLPEDEPVPEAEGQGFSDVFESTFGNNQSEQEGEEASNQDETTNQ